MNPEQDTPLYAAVVDEQSFDPEHDLDRSFNLDALIKSSYGLAPNHHAP